MHIQNQIRKLPELRGRQRLELDRKNLPSNLGDPSLVNNGSTIGQNLTQMKNDWFGALGRMAAHPQWGPNLGAGVTTAAVAIPLNVALSVSAGLPPSVGLFSGAIAGAVSAFFGGSEFQVSGPAAALNMMVFAIAQKMGAAGVAAAAILSGVLQVLMGVLGFGKLMRFIPEPVLIGFTSGVGLKLLDTQIPILFGIDIRVDEMFSQMFQPVWLFEVAWHNFICGTFVILAVMLGRSHPRVPASVIGIALATQLSLYLGWKIKKIGEIPQLLFNFSIPELSTTHWLELASMALPLAFLSGVESLLSAQAVDRMTSLRHNSNLELWGQGIGNFLSGVFGGMPTSGVIVRTNVNIQSGAKGRLSAIVHGVILLGSALFLGGLLQHIPTASLAGLLVVVGFRLLEIKEFFQLLMHNKIHCIGFVVALIGTLTNKLVWGLGGGIALILAVDWLIKSMGKTESSSIGMEKLTKGSHGKSVSSIGTQVSVPKVEASSGIRAHIQRSLGHRKDSSRRTAETLFAKGENWFKHLSQAAFVPPTSFVHPSASVIGRVVLGRHVHIAAESSVRADEGTPFYIGDHSNIQDGVVIHALKAQWVKVDQEDWAVYIGKHVSVAHQALIHGPCYIGDNCFIGFKAVVHNSTLADHCYVGIGATVVGVSVPSFKYVPHGVVIDSQAKVDSLANVSEQHLEFNHDVVEVNRGLVEAYAKIHVVTAVKSQNIKKGEN